MKRTREEIISEAKQMLEDAITNYDHADNETEKLMFEGEACGLSQLIEWIEESESEVKP